MLCVRHCPVTAVPLPKHDQEPSLLHWRMIIVLKEKIKACSVLTGGRQVLLLLLLFLFPPACLRETAGLDPGQAPPGSPWHKDVQCPHPLF